MKIEFVETTALSDVQQQALARLGAAVYPPDRLATLPGTEFSWAAPQWSVLLWDEAALVSRVGMVVREIRSNGQSKQIGGIGGVMTDPNRQGQGLASQALRAAAKHLATDVDVAYALLFCRPELVSFYNRFGWQIFQGKLFVEQPGGKVEFSANNAMLLNLQEQAPLDGVLDLQGLPW
jgi:GNAT superfamily N-acetyltransferase